MVILISVGVIITVAAILYHREIVMPVNQEIEPENDLSELTIDQLLEQ